MYAIRSYYGEYYRQNVSVSKTSAAFHGAIGLLAGIGVALVLLLGGWLVIRVV